MIHADRTSISFEQLSLLQSLSRSFSRLGSDYIFAHLSTQGWADRTVTSRPMRIDGWMVMLCVKGTMPLEIDLKRCELSPGSVACVGLDNIVRIPDEKPEDFETYVLILSPVFMRDLNIDLNVINISAMAKAKSVAPAPLRLDSDDACSMRLLLELIHRHTVSATATDHYKRSIARSLVAAMLYQLMMFGDRVAADETFATPRSRRSVYVHQFMSLVQRHHKTERSVAFYAGKLFISPKYLSLVIKEMTGRSASQWIDDMVVLEAKNLLRFSGKNIQQVAYELNFSNQSAFGKYFKHITGMSPSQYQRS